MVLTNNVVQVTKITLEASVLKAKFSLSPKQSFSITLDWLQMLVEFLDETEISIPELTNILSLVMQANFQPSEVEFLHL